MNSTQALADTWQKMVAYYPLQVGAYGDIGGAVFQEWAAELADFDAEVLQAATRQILHDETNAYPPNLPKFSRYCENEQARLKRARKTSSGPWRVPHESVIRIEVGKQRALCGEFAALVPKPPRMIRNWTRDDQAALERLIGQWDEATGLEGLCALIDDYPFSGGTHRQVLAQAEAA